MEKSKYPKVLQAYVQTKDGDFLAGEEIVNDEIEEKSFSQRYVRHRIGSRPLNKEEVKRLSLQGRIAYRTPAWVWPVIGGMGAIIVALASGWLQKILGLC